MVPYSFENKTHPNARLSHLKFGDAKIFQIKEPLFQKIHAQNAKNFCKKKKQKFFKRAQRKKRVCTENFSEKKISKHGKFISFHKQPLRDNFSQNNVIKIQL